MTEPSEASKVRHQEALCGNDDGLGPFRGALWTMLVSTPIWFVLLSLVAWAIGC